MGGEIVGGGLEQGSTLVEILGNRPSEFLSTGHTILVAEGGKPLHRPGHALGGHIESA